jgi:hypothetical protein
MKKLVILESPYAGYVEENVKYAKEAMRDSLSRGECPIASHLLYTQGGILDDNDSAQRQLGIDAGHEWLRVCEAIVIYQDLGISNGMQAAIMKAQELGVDRIYRSIR